jgi:hypothetical protein
VTKLPHGQLACFRIYPERGRSRLHFDVRIFQNIRAIRAYLKASRLPDRRLGRYGKALCSTYRIIRADHTLPVMGEILMPVRWLGAGLIAHECGHAALGWASRIQLNPVVDAVPRRGVLCASDTEERFCYGLGELNRQIIVQLWDRGLVK